ncbi:MAG: hypothetical protein PF542_06965 [Nanoarchaeota archaeon]|nr:hypothetical protein [Nanoarchaeota archaeon]
MVNQELVTYFQEGMNRGVSLIKLKSDLLENGWRPEDVQSALSFIGGNKVSNTSSPILKPGILLVGFLFVLIVGSFFFILFYDKGTSLTEDDLEKGQSIKLIRESVMINLNGKTSTITLEEAYSNYTKIKINGVSVTLNLSEDKKVDLDSDGINDIIIRLEKISGGIPEIYLKKLDRVVTLINYTIPIVNETIPENFTVVVNSTCVENWTCGDWGNCTDEEKARTCVDNAGCNTTLNKPSVLRACEVEKQVNETVKEFCIGKSNSTVDYFYFSNNETHFCNDSVEFPFNGTVISCCVEDTVAENTKESFCEYEEGIYINSTQICTGISSLFEFNGDDVECCKVGNVYDKFILSGEFNDSWNSLISSGYCVQNFSEKIRFCEPHKCTYTHPFGGEYDMGVIIEEDGICHIYSENMGQSYEYCKINETFRDEYSDYYANFTDDYYLEAANISFSTASIGSEPMNAKEKATDQGDCRFALS